MRPRSRRIARLTALAVVGALAVGTAPVAAYQAGDRAARSGVGGCRLFPANNYWNADVSHLPRNKHSKQWLSHMSPKTRLHPDFGPSFGAQPVPYGIPITLVGGQHRRVKVKFHYAGESNHVRYPLGKDTRIEGGNKSDGDRHAIIVDKSTCRLYETFATRHRKDGWHAGSGAVWNLHTNKLRPNGWTSADAAGLPILPGLLRYREVELVGKVSHAIRFTTDVTARRHIWPARHDAGSVSSRAYPPMGARFRLRSGFSLKGYRTDTVVVLRAMKRYGLVLADNGSPWFFQGSADRRWPTGLLNELKTIPARAFVAVKTHPLQVAPNSGATH